MSNNKMPTYFGWPGTIWAISDLHLNHDKIIEFERDEFKTIQEHNETIIKRINQKVAKTDTLICLGDLGFNWENLIDQIKCENKILILGNHDNLPKYIYYTHFNMVFNGPFFINQFMVLSHEPWPGCGEYCINVHGHLHNAHLDLPNYFNISAKEINYTPINLNDIYLKVDGLKRNHETFLKEWYVDHYVFERERLSSVPIIDGHLITHYKDVPEIINEFNEINRTRYRTASIDWLTYQEPCDLHEFIFESLERINKNERKG